MGNEEQAESHHQYARNLKDRMHRAHTIARDNVGAAQVYHKKYYDQKQNFSAYEEGDLVYRI